MSQQHGRTRIRRVHATVQPQAVCERLWILWVRAPPRAYGTERKGKGDGMGNNLWRGRAGGLHSVRNRNRRIVRSFRAVWRRPCAPVSGFYEGLRRRLHQEPVLTGLRLRECSNSNPATSNLCSKCFREHEVAQQKKMEMHEPKVLEEPPALLPGASLSSLVAPVSTEKANAQVEAPLPAAQDQTVQSSQQEDEKDDKATIQVHKNRCFSCNKKVGLTGFKCRCGYIFCSVHRYSDKHECTFDYKSAGRDAIAKANPTVVASKVQKI